MIRVADHAGSEIVPVWPLVEVALAFVKRAVPKSVSGRICAPREVTADGASATHSAELMSGADMRSVLAKLFPVVRLLSRTLTAVPVAFTDAAIRSPAEIFRG